MAAGRQIEKLEKEISKLLAIINNLVQENYELKCFKQQPDVVPMSYSTSHEKRQRN